MKATFILILVDVVVLSYRFKAIWIFIKQKEKLLLMVSENVLVSNTINVSISSVNSKLNFTSYILLYDFIFCHTEKLVDLSLSIIIKKIHNVISIVIMSTLWSSNTIFLLLLCAYV